MLNIEKVKSMTKAAAYEKGPEKKNIEISSYFRGDYLGLQMVKSGIAYAVSFGILCLLWAMGRMEELMLMLSRPEYVESVLRTMILLFAAGLICYEIAVYVYYTEKFRRAKKSIAAYRSQLKNISKFYENQESGAEHEVPDGEKTI